VLKQRERKIHVKTRIALVAAALVMVVGLSQAFGDTATVEKARAVFEKTKDSVIWVTAVVNIEITGGGRNLGTREQKVQAIGTVIDPSGLVAVALSAIDPGSSINGTTQLVGGQPIKLTAESKHSQVKFMLPSGTEVDAKIVLTDDVLDLAFVMPEKAGTKLDVPVVKMEKNAKVEVLDQVVCLGRMPKAMDQAPAVAMSEISSIVTKPRLFYMGGRNLSGPVFTLDGQPLGITVAYRADMGGGNSVVSLVIVPAEEVAKSAKQALAKKDEPTTKESKDEPKKDEPKKEEK
jgi:hypothetical protein